MLDSLPDLVYTTFAVNETVSQLADAPRREKLICHASLAVAK